MHRLLTPAALACLLAVAGCGGDEDKPDDTTAVKATVAAFAKAVEAKDYNTLCDEVFAPELLEGLQTMGLPCEVAMKTSLGEVSEPHLTVGKITVTDDGATAEIKSSAAGQPPSSDTLVLKQVDGDWRVSSLSEAAAAAETETPAEDGEEESEAPPTPTPTS